MKNDLIDNNNDDNTITMPADLMLSVMQSLTEATASLTALMVTAQQLNAPVRVPRAQYPKNQKILAYLEKQGSISPMEALINFGVMRLAPAIYDLREAGYKITTNIRTDAQGKHYARYTLEG